MEDPSVVDSHGMAAGYCDDEQEETSTLMHTRAPERTSTEWTDEKHSLFLKSMEATFVNQLYKSSTLFDHPHNTTSSPNKFKVLRDGRWSKINFKVDEVVANQEDGVILANPWVKRYRSSERQPIRKFPASREKAQTPSHNFRLWRQDSAGSNAEVTGQNFNDEDTEEEKCRTVHEAKIRTDEDIDGKKCNPIHEGKRIRTSTDTVSSNDQVVPFENTVQADAAAEDHETS